MTAATKHRFFRQLNPTGFPQHIPVKDNFLSNYSLMDHSDTNCIMGYDRLPLSPMQPFLMHQVE